MTDIADGIVGDWLVVGWFTPDYRSLAETFAANLRERGIPFHLFAKPKPEGTDWLDLVLRMKPAVVLEAMAAYPDKTIVLMDVDCTVRGDMAPMTQFAGDVGVAAFTGTSTNRPKDWRVWFAISTRVAVFRPTEGALAFAKEWANQVKTHGGHEERCMALAFLASRETRFSYIDLAYSGRDTSQLPDGIIVHDSAHSAQKQRDRSALMQLLRNIEVRFFRTGRSQRAKIPLSGGHVLKSADR